MLWVIDVPVACSSCVEVKSVMSVGGKVSCSVLVENVPSVFVMLVFEEFYCDSSLVIVGVVSSCWLEPIVCILECVKGDCSFEVFW